MNKQARVYLILSRLLRVAALGLALGIVALLGYLVWQQTDASALKVSFYSVRTDKVDSNVRIVQLSDLHGATFGKDNERLVVRVASLAPDVIAITGDMHTQGQDDYPLVVSLVEKLAAIAPTYFSFGNHEYVDFLFAKDLGVWKMLAEAGATVLNCTDATLDVRGNTLAIGGICVGNATFENNEVRAFLEKFSEREAFTLLLSHYPEIFQSRMNEYPVDLALAGHEHGGLIRVPVVGALYSEGQGLFPKLTEGKITRDAFTLVISRGLGTHGFIPRVNNEPEIVVVDLNWY